MLAVHSDKGGIAIVRRTYREDIDWLRAIAVLAVVAFHFGAPAIYGGFRGGGIFFFIFRFLISTIIRTGGPRDKFSIFRFFVPRVRKLLPAPYSLVAFI